MEPQTECTYGKFFDDYQSPGEDDPRQKRQPQIARPRYLCPPFLHKEEIQSRMENNR
jgi:hypothetical protein